MASNTPPLTEANLPEYDKTELAGERELRKKVKACQDSAKAAQEEIKKLQQEKKDITNESKQFDKSPESKEMSKEEREKRKLDYKNRSKAVDSKMKALQGTAKQKCRLSHKGCVPSDSSKKSVMPKTITDDLNKKYKTNVDFEKLSAFEGGAFQKGYIPWWPYLNSQGYPTIIAMKSSNGATEPRIKGEYNNAPKNKSGTTVGVGVDIGQFSSDKFFKLLDHSNKDSGILTDSELESLKKKLSPYFGKQGGEACKYLQDHPLELSEKEVNFLSRSEHDEKLGAAIKSYEKYVKDHKATVSGPEKFSDLTKEQQTALLSNGYQYGAPKQGLIEAIAKGDRTKIPGGLRESKYLHDSMPPPAKKN